MNITEISAWPRIAIISGVDRRVLAGTITAPALCTAGVGDDPAQAVLVGQRDRDAVALAHAVVDEPARGLVRLLVPLRGT